MNVIVIEPWQERTAPQLGQGHVDRDESSQDDSGAGWCH